MLLCGLRSAEVMQLQRGDVLDEDRQLRVRGKGQRDRVLPLPDVVAASIADYVRWERPAHCATPRLFVILQGPRRGSPMTMAGLRSLFRQRRRDHAVARANPHRFRHTFGADMARAGVRLPILQRMIGHTDGGTTLRYIQLSMADIADEYRRAVDELNGVIGCVDRCSLATRSGSRTKPQHRFDGDGGRGVHAQSLRFLPRRSAFYERPADAARLPQCAHFIAGSSGVVYHSRSSRPHCFNTSWQRPSTVESRPR